MATQSSTDRFCKLIRELHYTVENLKKRDREKSSEYTPFKARTEVIKLALKSIQPGFEYAAKIITIRVRSGYRSTFLRPIYSYPDEVGAFSHDVDAGDQDNLDFGLPTFGSAPIATGRPETSGIAIGAFSTKQRKGRSGEPKTFGDYAPEFLDRIQKAYRGVHRFDATWSIDSKGKWRESGTCFVFANMKVGSGPTAERTSQIQQMIVVYVFDRSKAHNIEQAIRGEAKLVGEIIDLMFQSLDTIGDHERESFRKDALRKVASLVPNFTDPVTPPAEDVGALLQAITELFRDHPSLGPFLRFHQSRKRQRARDNENGEDQNWIRFITIKFAQHGSGRHTSYEPTFSIYPKAWARKNYVGSYLVAHRDRRSTVKFLTYLNLRNDARFEGGGFPLYEEFAAPYEKIQKDHCPPPVLRDIYYRPDASDKRRRCIVLTESDGKLWTALHREHSTKRAGQKNQRTKTTAAFLLTRRTSLSSSSTGDTDELPYAALVFESAALDAFSDADLELLSLLVDACAPLIASLKLGGTEIEYVDKIKRAYVNYNAGGGDQIFGGVIFELLRLDRFALHAILDSDKNSPVWSGSGVDRSTHISKEEAVRLIGGPLKNLPLTREEWDYTKAHDAELLKRLPAYERETDRIDWLIANRDFLEDWRDDLDKIEPFLEAVPSNDMWHCYLSVIPRALADRGADAGQLSFSLLDPGYGASAMFIVGVDPEIRQVLKLARADKIKNEQKAYTKFVRFCIPLAAHLPDGEIPIENSGAKDEPGFGVLISDLIGERTTRNANRPLSFLDACRRLVLEKNDDGAAKGIESALKDHFEANIILWTESGPRLDAALQELSQLDTPSAVRWAARLEKKPYDRDGMNRRLRMTYPSRLKELAIPQSEDAKPTSPRADILVSRVLTACEKYYNTIMIRDRPVLLQDSKDSLPDHLVALHRLFSATGGHELPPFGALDHAIIHGDLNCRNLTWSDDYKQFFIIDFEYVKAGFSGADQLKLIMSLISELVPSMLRHDVPDPHSVDLAHVATIQLIEYVSHVANAIHPAPHATINDLQIEPNDKLGSIMKCLVQLTKINWKDQQIAQFWRYALSCFAMREFEYSLDSITSVHLASLQEGADMISGTVSYKVMKQKAPFRTWASARLFYSYLALLATLKGSTKPHAIR
jgi:DNA-binding MarR family transcriptional regulator